MSIFSPTIRTASSTSRARVRDVLPNLFLGFHAPGPKNSITDVPSILVSTQSVHKPLGHNPDRPKSAINTGVTVILPRPDWFHAACYAGVHRFNGSGELTGTHWLEETGLLNSPIVLTNSLSVGAAYSGIYRYAIREYGDATTGLVDWFLLPVVGETYDGFMNDIGAMAVTEDMVVKGIETANADRVAEGNTGGGTGMLCQGFKAGTGSSSRVIEGNVRGEDTTFTVGVLAQVNFGKPNDLKFGDVPVGRIFAKEDGIDLRDARSAKFTTVEIPADMSAGGTSDKEKVKEGSIIVIIATDAPLHPTQLRRLAQRATVGVARTGGWGSNTSGDIFLAFSTANKNAVLREPPTNPGVEEKDIRYTASVGVQGTVDVLQDTTINGIFEGVVEATSEAIWNSLCMAEGMTGPEGRRVEAIDLDRLKRVVERYGSGI